jgi:hypothetical protein
MMHQSIATINSPEFINLQPLDINPLMSKCEIKVLYVGENRNHSYISEDVAKDMAKTLRGAPIVGYYKEDKEDFADHGEQVILDDEGVKFNCLTKPYGFVAPDAKVWFQDFEDTDDFGNKITRKYLMTTGYLWTGQYEEAKRVIEKGNNQSMELDESSLDGHWSTNVNNGMDFFIINDAIFSKLCILGEDVEPCFEGASVTAPQVSKSFSKVDDNFKQTLYTMMQDLRYALEEGGKNMELEEKEVETVEEEVKTEEETVEAEETESSIETETTSTEAEVENESEEEPTEEETTESENESSEEEPESETEEAEGDAPSDYSDNEEEESEEEEPLDNSDDVETKKKEYSAEEYELLKSNYDELETKYNELVEFKKNVELEKKQELINSFYMLSDEDKKDVKEHMSEYSLEEIESKLCVICVKNKVNFEKDNLDENNNKVEEENSAVATFNIDNNESSEIPAWISACINTQNSKN